MEKRWGIKQLWKRIVGMLLCATVLCQGVLPGSISTVKAADGDVSTFYKFLDSSGTTISFDGSNIYTLNDSTTTITLALSNTSGTGSDWLNDVSVTFDPLTEDSAKVVEVREITRNDGTVSSYSFTLVRKGPGNAGISGSIRKTGYGDLTFNFTVQVPLTVDRTQNTGVTGVAYSNIVYGETTEATRRLLIANPGIQYQVKLKNVDLGVTTGSSMGTVYDYTNCGLIWETQVEGVSNDKIITIDNNGIITAVGAGEADVVITTNAGASSSGQQLSATIHVIVDLNFSIEDLLYNPDGTLNFDNYRHSVVMVDLNQNYFYTTAANASDLVWSVYNSDGDKTTDVVIIPSTSQDGKCYIESAKAGKYTVYATVDLDRDPTAVSTNSYFFAKLEITVPVDFTSKYIVMNVKDKYNIPGNSTISASDFTFESANRLIATVSNKGVITAKRAGDTTITCTVKAGVELYDSEGHLITTVVYTLKVIDGFTLTQSEATMYVSSTLQLASLASDTSKSIVWESSDTSIATVDEEGLVTTLNKAGVVTITATQTINGVEKTAECAITVIASITSITLDPPSISLEIGEFSTVKATITPSLTTYALSWVSSDENVVLISEANGLTATIEGANAGTAVVMAINKDNVVVGSCKVTVLESASGISISETSVRVNQSLGKYQLYATITPSTTTNRNVLWTSSNPSVATVDNNGLVKFVSYGEVTIIATSEDQPTLTAMCNMIISVPVNSLTLDASNVTVEVGKTYRLTYTVLPDTAYEKTVTFKTMDASVVAVDSTGLLTGKKAGTTYVTVTTADGSLSKVCTVKVIQSATKLKLSASSLHLDVDEFYTLEATFTPKTATNTTLIWTTNDNKIAKVDTKGKVTAAGAGSTIIVATTDTGYTALCYVTVNQPIESMTLDYEEVTVAMGDEIELIPQILPEDVTNTDVSWKSSNEDVATVNEDGVVTGVLGGMAVITCISDEGNHTATCVVTVEETVTGIKLNKSSYKLGLDKKYTLVATVTNATASNQKVTWRSSDTSICTVSSKGVIYGKKLGYATITATTTDGSDVEAECEVRVVTLVTSVTVNKSIMNLVVGDSSTLTAKIKPSNATYKKANFVSSNTGVAIVDTDGKVTAIGEGTCNITAKAKDSSGKKAICVVMVRPYVAATGLTLSQTDITLGVGGTETVSYSMKPNNATDSLTWSSNNKAVATVGKNSGTIKGISAGTAIVTATTTSGKTANVRVTVVGLSVTSITLEQYTEFRLTVEGYNGAVQWLSGDNELLKITNGTISTRRIGVTTVTAIVNGARLTCRVRVVPIE